MSTSLTIISWRDIPAQVVAKNGRNRHRAALPGRFQDAIDRAAMRAGLSGADDYVAEWRRETVSCGEDVAAEVAALASRLDEQHPDDVLARFVDNRGFRPEEAGEPQ